MPNEVTKTCADLLAAADPGVEADLMVELGISVARLELTNVSFVGSDGPDSPDTIFQ